MATSHDEPLSMSAHVVWLKRDLRVRDHRPLIDAVDASIQDRVPVVVLYVYEPELLQSPEWDAAHSDFISACLDDLDDALTVTGTRLTRIHAEATEAFDIVAARLGSERGLAGLWSHEETGNALTFARDRRVASWCRRTGTPWREIPQHGVFRGLRDRDGWSSRWTRRMSPPPMKPPERVPCVTRSTAGWDFGTPLPTRELGRSRVERGSIQPGGERAAAETLASFLNHRGVGYRADMASPVSGFQGCSRLSPHFAWGSISVRTVHHALRDRLAELKASPRSAHDSRWLKSLTSFQARLRWHCHFIQKLESEPEIEHRNMNRAYDAMRQEDEDAWTDTERDRYLAWATGRTGYPFVDACMRCLASTGWMNFRMRSMLVSFASNHLWLHWAPTARHLARLFVDFEPGIHYSQMQMQSGTTGINTVRIYNPIKQGKDQDPTGGFVRTWVPELADVPDEHIHEPWKWSRHPEGSLFKPGRDDPSYPDPIVDHAEAYRAAQQRIFAVRGTANARREARRVFDRHGSRKKPRGAPESRGFGPGSSATGG